MVTHSTVLSWRIPGMGEFCGRPSMGSHRVRHDWSDLASAAAVGVYHSPDLMGGNSKPTFFSHFRDVEIPLPIKRWVLPQRFLDI